MPNKERNELVNWFFGSHTNFLEKQGIIDHVKNFNSKSDTQEMDALVFEKNKKHALWLAYSSSHIYIVRDNSDSAKILLKRTKKDFKYRITDDRTPKLEIERTKIPLPFDTGLTGNTQTFIETLDNNVIGH